MILFISFSKTKQLKIKVMQKQLTIPLVNTLLISF